MRDLQQRCKGKDLFDLWMIFSADLANIDKTLKIFKKYCDHSKIGYGAVICFVEKDVPLSRDVTAIPAGYISKD